MNRAIQTISLVVFLSTFVARGGELQSFQGIEFGSKIGEGKFTGPDEDGDYSYVPEGKKPNPAIQYFVSATCKSKRIYMVLISHTAPVAAGGVLKREYLKALQGYSKLWTPAVKGDEVWTQQYKIVKAVVPDGLSPDDFHVFTFRDSKNEIRQLMFVMLIQTEDTATLRVSVTDVKLSELDDAEKEDTAAISKEDGNTMKRDMPVGFAAQADQQEAKKTKATSATTNGNVKVLESFCGIKFGNRMSEIMQMMGSIDSARKCFCSSFDMERKFLRYDDSITVRGTVRAKQIFSVELNSDESIDSAESATRLAAETLVVLEKKYDIKPEKEVLSVKNIFGISVPVTFYTFSFKGAEIVVAVSPEENKVILRAENLALKYRSQKEFTKTQSVENAADVL